MRQSAHLVSVSQIKDKLAERIDELVAELLPNAVRSGHEYFVGGVSGEPGRSMAINYHPSKAGVWSDFASTESGDALDLVRAVLFGYSPNGMVDAIKWSKSWLGLDGLEPSRLDIQRQEARTKARRLEGELEDARKRDLAHRIFRGAEHRIAGTLADRYLSGRGIDIRELGAQPGVLAYEAGCWCEEAGRTLPAMIAAIKRGNTIVGIHRTYLHEHADGHVTKALLLNPKMTLGPFRGGCIPISRGADGLTWGELHKSDAPTTVVLAEGIENAIVAAIKAPQLRVLACVSLAGMAAVELPACVNRVTLAADNDAADSTAATKGFPKVIEAHQAAGRKVGITRPPAGIKDFNDWLLVLRAGASSAMPPPGGEQPSEHRTRSD